MLMFKGFSGQTSDFFWELVFNNDREWLHEHKQEFETLLNRPLKELAEETAALLAERFPQMEPKAHVSRIWRDSRRLFGRPPLKEEMWFEIRSKSAPDNSATFYFVIKPAGIGWGMGFWCAEASQMERFRASIDANPAKFEKLAAGIAKMKSYKVEGPEYKRRKREFGNATDEWYNRKGLSVNHSEDFGEKAESAKLPAILADEFSSLMPMYDYLLQHCRSDDINN